MRKARHVPIRGAEVGDHHGCPLAGQCLGGCGANATAAPGDEGNFAGKPRHHAATVARAAAARPESRPNTAPFSTEVEPVYVP